MICTNETSQIELPCSYYDSMDQKKVPSKCPHAILTLETLSFLLLIISEFYHKVFDGLKRFLAQRDITLLSSAVTENPITILFANNPSNDGSSRGVQMFSTFKAPYTGLKITLISKWGIIPFATKCTVHIFQLLHNDKDEGG